MARSDYTNDRMNDYANNRRSDFTSSRRSDYTNCICGYHGSGSNCSEQRYPPKCEGCGFDRETYNQRMEVLRQTRLKEIGLAARGRLLRDWGVRTVWELRGWKV